MLNEDYKDMLRALSDEKVKFLLVGAPLHSLNKEDFQKDGNIFQIGVAPRRIDIIASASGLQFEERYGRSLSVNIEGIKVRSYKHWSPQPKTHSA